MASKSQLVAEIQQWMTDEDITPVVDSWIRSAEDNFNRVLRHRSQYARQRADGGDADGNPSRFLPLPKDFLEMRRFKLGVEGQPNLKQVSPEALCVVNQGTPRTYAVHRQIELDSAVDRDTEFEMLFYQKYPRLGDLDAQNNVITTNWMLENYYSIYLFGSLMQAGPYERSDQRLATFQNLYTMHLRSLQESDLHARLNQGEAAIEIRAGSMMVV